MKWISIIICFLLCNSVYSQNEFYFNGAADVIMRYPPRGSGGRAIVHDDGNTLTLNYGGDFSGGTRLGSGFHVKSSGDITIHHSLGTNDYTNIGQHKGQVRITNGLGNYNSRALEFALLDNGTGIVQANEAYVGYNNLVLNPVSGNVGIGILTPAEKLSVNGRIRAKEVKVEISNWPDYVFDERYKLHALTALESFIKTNKHLPEMPSAKEAEEKGINLGEMNAKLLEKIEELTLYIIQQDKIIYEYGKRFDFLQKEINQIKNMQ